MSTKLPQFINNKNKGVIHILISRDEIYFTGLFDDIWKILSNEENTQYFNNLKNTLSELKDSNIIKTIFLNDKTNALSKKIVDSADKLSFSSKKECNNVDNELIPIFTGIFQDNNNISNDYYYSAKKLDLNNVFPMKNNANIKSNTLNLFKDFLEELKLVSKEEQLYFLLEKYFWSISAKKESKDVSLFDHSKTKAAIALSLYEQYENGYISEDELKDIENLDKEQFILLNGDLSGIQDFIFDIPSKKASKSLKGRSMYLNLLLDVIVKYIIKNLNLKRANILYNGGGNFYIIAPKSKKKEILELQKDISEKLLKAHQGDLYLALDSIEFAPKEFKDFTKLWGKVKKKVEKQKHSRWNEIGLDNNYNKIFGPLDEGTAENDHCHICGVSKEIRRVESSSKDDNTEQKICVLCDSFVDLTNDLKDSNYLNLDSVENLEKHNNYNEILSSFGYSFSFSNTKLNSDETYKLNNTDFIKEGCTGFRFGAYNLPHKNYRQITFEELAESSVNEDLGDKKLGVLKLDVDNLGAIFTKGLEDDRSIARVTNLSRMMGLFYEGYINKVISDNDWEDKIYVVFSGGDDTFIVGSWNIILEFAEEFYNKFREYTCNNKYITFSAGLGVFKHNYPINRSAHLTENYLDEAKTIEFTSQEEVVPIKNKINFLGETFNWEELKRIKSIKDILYDLVENKGYGHGVLRKVYKSTLGFKNILEDSTRGIYENIKLWRLSYYLREVKDNDEKIAEKLIQEYEDIVIHNLTGKSDEDMINNIMIIPAAVRWTEMATRKFKEG